MATYSGRGRGTFRLYGEGYTGKQRGVFGMQRVFTGKMRGVFRQPDTSLDLYQYWISTSPIDFSTTPTGTSATLPIESAALTLPGAGLTADYYVGVRRQNAYGMQSQNTMQYQFTIDENGDRVMPPPSGPTDVVLTALSGLTVRVQARYQYRLEGVGIRPDTNKPWNLKADTWVVVYTSDGSTPTPGVSDEVYISTVESDGVAKLDVALGPFTEGQTIKVLVVMERNFDLIQSENTTVYSVVATATGPDVVNPHIFTGTQFEENQ